MVSIFPLQSISKCRGRGLEKLTHTNILLFIKSPRPPPSRFSIYWWFLSEPVSITMVINWWLCNSSIFSIFSSWPSPFYYKQESPPHICTIIYYLSIYHLPVIYHHWYRHRFLFSQRFIFLSCFGAQIVLFQIQPVEAPLSWLMCLCDMSHHNFESLLNFYHKNVVHGSPCTHPAPALESAISLRAQVSV